jgi:hypothetical protein
MAQIRQSLRVTMIHIFLSVLSVIFEVALVEETGRQVEPLVQIAH